MPANPSLVEQLSGYKQSGMSPADAAAALMGGGQATSAALAVESLDTQGAGSDAASVEEAIGADDLSMALAAAFDRAITAAELASIIHTQFPDLSALGVAQAVQAGLPNTSEQDMYNALTGCGFPAAVAQGAVNILYPTTATVQANQGWQQTGVNLTGQQHTNVACTGGSWTANPETGMCGPYGNGAFIAKPGYTLPGAPEGALIGKVGENAPFLIGGSALAPGGQSGMLSLCINDDLNGIYGAGLADNIGSVTVFIETAAPS